MNKVILNNDEVKILNVLLDYILINEKKHYEESVINDKDMHIYQYAKFIKLSLKNTPANYE